jgi:hypothetical protein
MVPVSYCQPALRVGEGGDDMARSKGSGGKKSSGGSYRSAISGRYVTLKHSKSSPRTTVKESRSNKGSK